MATVTKDFRIKSGLVVEGTNATVDGSDIITEDIITGGTQTNIAVTYDAQNKVLNFVAENGVADSTTDDLTEGTSNLYYTDARARGAVSVEATGPLTYNSTSGEFDLSTGTGLEVAVTGELKIDETWLDTEIANGAVAAISVEPLTPLTYDNGEVGFTLGLFNGGLGLDTNNNGLEIDRTTVDTWYDAAGSAAQALSDANDYTDSAISGLSTTLSIAGDTGTDTVNLQSDTLAFAGGTGIDIAVTDNTVTASIDSTVATLSGSQTLTNKELGSGTALKANLNANMYKITSLLDPTDGLDAANKQYVDTKISDLVDGAPALLDTLNELAAAINDDASFASTVTTAIGEKVAKAGDTMTGDLSFGNTNTVTNIVDPTNAQDAATKNYVDTELDSYLNSTSGSEGTTILYVQDYVGTAIETGDATATPTYLAIDYNSVAKQVAATVTAGGTGTDVAYSFDGALFRTAKFLVKIAYGTHTQVSEVLLTLDTSNNVAITEYAMVGTNGSLGDITAEYGVIDVVTNGVKLIVNSATSGAEITVMGTLLV